MKRYLAVASTPYDVVAAVTLAQVTGPVLGVNEVVVDDVVNLAVYLKDTDARDQAWWTGVVAAHDGTAGQQRAAQAAVEATNHATLESRATTTLADLRTYIALETPDAGQTTAAVKLLCRVAVGLIRLVLRRFDSTD